MSVIEIDQGSLNQLQRLVFDLKEAAETVAGSRLSLRDYLAGQALAGMLAGGYYSRASECAYQVADKALAARDAKATS